MPQHYLSGELSFFLLLTTGLLTGLSHCVGMCGPLVGAFALRRRAERRELSTPLLYFQIGRLFTYVLLGMAFGLIGSLVWVASALRDWQAMVSVGLGVLVIFLGLSLLGLLPVVSWLTSGGLARRVGGWLKYWLDSTHPAAPFLLGGINGLLPCGAVYAMALLAATSACQAPTTSDLASTVTSLVTMTGEALKGASLMLIFGLGTLPAMLGVGLSAGWLGWRWRSGFYRVAALLVVIVGVQLTLRGLAAGGHLPHAMLGEVMVW